MKERRNRARYRLLPAALIALFLWYAPQESAAVGLPLQSLNVQLEVTDHHLPFDWKLDVFATEGLMAWLGAMHPRPLINYETVRWTVEKERRVEQVAISWGIRMSELQALNPERNLERDEILEPGTQLVVFRADPQKRTQSIGSANRGRLRNALPMPESDFWILRDSRRFYWGTRLNVETLAETFIDYGLAFPGAQKPRLGDLSKKRGRYLKPHRSHQSGRDVDLGYIGITEDVHYTWVRVSPDTLDAEKTWFIIKRLIDSGAVQNIYIDRRLQYVLNEEAEEDYTEEELAEIIEYPRREGSHSAIIQHWPGHRNHMHIRFRCEAWNRRCRK